jgi:hypothetical protein
MPPPPTPTPITFAASPAPSECTVEPRPEDDFVAVADIVTPTNDQDAAQSLASEEELPRGQPADSGTTAAIEALERARVACLNADDWQRLLAFYTDGFLREILATYGPDGSTDIAADFLAAPKPFGVRDRAPVRVRDVRRLPDGNVGAVVDTCEQIAFHIYHNVDGHWLIAEVINMDRPHSSCILPQASASSPTP